MSGSGRKITLRPDWPAFRVCLTVSAVSKGLNCWKASAFATYYSAKQQGNSSVSTPHLTSKPDKMPKVRTEKPDRPAPYDADKRHSDAEKKITNGENKSSEADVKPAEIAVKPVDAEVHLNDVEMKPVEADNKTAEGEKIPEESGKKAVEEAKKPAEGEKKSSGWGSGGQLFGTENNELTFQGAGFKDKEKALETLRLLDGRDISYQFQIINSMYHRAKVILKRTKDTEKVRNLSEAIEVFENWLNDYRAHSRSRENFSYLPVETIEAFVPLAERYGIKMDAPGTNFFQAYKHVEGDLKRLRVSKVDKEDEKSVTWDVKRNTHLRELSERMKTEHLPLFETDLEYRGLPTKEHVEMIMWGYSSEVTKIKKTIPLISQKLNGNADTKPESD